MSYHGLPYIISNLPKWTFTTLKDFRIGSCMRAGDMVYKFTLGMKHPVEERSGAQGRARVFRFLGRSGPAGQLHRRPHTGSDWQ